MNVYSSNNFPGWLIPVILVAFFGLIVLLVILIKKHTKLFGGDEKPKSEKEVAEEELNRILEPVEDDEAKASMENYVQNEADQPEAKEEETQGEDKPIL